MKIVVPFILAAAIGGWGQPQAHASQASLPDQKTIIDEARTIAQAYDELGWFSGTILLAHGGSPVYRASFGMSDREAGTPNGQNTRYNLGSIMKHYTAVLVLQQVQDGLIGLDDALESFDLGFPAETAGRITVRQLLHHRSGFSDRYPVAYQADPLAFDTIDKRLELLKEAPLLFEPGSEYRYSNYGYVVLGAILEKATGKPFAILLKENIFDRLGLKDSVYPFPDDSRNQSLRYTFNYAGEQVLVGVTEHHGPDGGIEATADDVLAFYLALFHDDRLLSHDKNAIREYFAVDGTHWTAFGGGEGVSAAVELDLENHYQVIVLANSDHLVAEEISGRIYSFIQSGHYDPIRLPPNVFAWTTYRELGPEAFETGFADRYQTAGYTQFIGRTLNELGMSLLGAAQWKEAFDVLGTLAALFPQAPQVYDSLAFAYRAKGEPENAARAFRRALALQPGFSSDYSADNYGLGHLGSE